MTRIKFYTAIAAVIILAASCGKQPASLEFKTFEIEGFVKHPKGADDNHGLQYRFSFSYPSKYDDFAILAEVTVAAEYVFSIKEIYTP